MPELGRIVSKVRSKNAGPFWLTIDVFCGDSATFERVSASLKDEAVARLYGVDRQLLKRFEIPSLNVVKFSVPRPVVQGKRTDRDMHGAGWGCLLEELEID
ncbi:MAG TPA: DUF4387 family protein [Albidovulum sp.]|uniref:DUF4387 family protein n=1 Tax=Albidovulum sp. TaxID=1872424 RepID=UPI002C47DA7E|nr:DUF4387 family protein [Albidovulum sp.]